MIFHLMPRTDWERTTDDIVARPGVEGFVHCCDERQLQDVRSRYFAAHEAVVALALDPTHLDDETRYELGSEGEPERFPHVYGPIRREQVLLVREL